MNAGLSLTITAHGLQVQLKSTILSKFSFELEPLPSPAEALIQYSKGKLPHGEVQKHSLFTSVCLAARAIIRFLLCLSSAKLRAIVGIKLTAQTAGAHSRHRRNRKQIGGGTETLGLEGPCSQEASDEYNRSLPATTLSSPNCLHRNQSSAAAAIQRDLRRW